jgi:hypothetical protein
MMLEKARFRYEKNLRLARIFLIVQFFLVFTLYKISTMSFKVCSSSLKKSLVSTHFEFVS